MSSRYKPSGFIKPKYYSSRTMASEKRQAIYAARRTAMLKSPYLKGYVRNEGAYRRSIPFGGEKKYADMGIGASGTAATTAATNGTVLTFYNISSSFGGPSSSLLQIVQGTTKNNRIGNKIRVVSLRGRYILTLPSSTSGDIIRIILYEDKQANGGAAAVANILEDGALTSLQAMDYVDRIRIIKDKVVVLNPNVGSSGSSSTPFLKHFKFNHKCNQEIHYSSTTGAITEIQSHNFGIMVISETDNINIAGICRVGFFDK